MAIGWIEFFSIFCVNEPIKLVNGSFEFSQGLFPFLLESDEFFLLSFLLLEVLLFLFDIKLVFVNDVLKLDGIGHSKVAVMLLVVAAVMLFHLGHFVDATYFDSVTLVVGRAIGFVNLTIELIVFGFESCGFHFSGVSSHVWVIVYVRLANLNEAGMIWSNFSSIKLEEVSALVHKSVELIVVLHPVVFHMFLCIQF